MQPRLSPRTGIRQMLIVVLNIQLNRGPELLLIGEAAGGAGFLPRLSEDGEQDGSKDGNDSDDHEQFDEGECSYPNPDPLSHEWFSSRGEQLLACVACW